MFGARIRSSILQSYAFMASYSGVYMQAEVDPGIARTRVRDHVNTLVRERERDGER